MSNILKLKIRRLWLHQGPVVLRKEDRVQSVKCADECLEQFRRKGSVEATTGLADLLCRIYFKGKQSTEERAVFVNKNTEVFSLKECPCCRELSMMVVPVSEFEVCSVCGWEDSDEEFYNEYCEDGPKMWRLYEERERYQVSLRKPMTKSVSRRRSRIKDVSYALLDQFDSRNNDLDGYWAVGQLYKYALKEGVLAVSLDILGGKTTPANQACEQVAQIYRTVLKRHLRNRDISLEWLQSVIISISFKNATGAKKFRSSYGDPYVCEVVIKCVSGCVRSSARTGYCWPHDPKRETKRGIQDQDTIGLDGDGDEIDFIEDVEACFGVCFSDKEAKNTYTVGDLFETLLGKLNLRYGPASAVLCPTQRAFYLIRSAIESCTDTKVTPETLFSDLGLVDHKKIAEHLKLKRLPHTGNISFDIRLYGLGLLAFLSVVFFADMHVVPLAAAVLWLSFAPWLLPAKYTGTVGELATELAALNHDYMQRNGAKQNEKTVWDSLEAVCKQHLGRTKNEITPMTFLLAGD
jgi:Cysteine-rich CPCC